MVLLVIGSASAEEWPQSEDYMTQEEDYDPSQIEQYDMPQGQDYGILQSADYPHQMSHDLKESSLLQGEDDDNDGSDEEEVNNQDQDLEDTQKAKGDLN